MYQRTAIAAAPLTLALFAASCSVRAPAAPDGLPDLNRVPVVVESEDPSPIGYGTPSSDRVDIDPFASVLPAGELVVEEFDPQRRRRRLSPRQRRERGDRPNFSAFAMISVGSGDFELRDESRPKDETHANLVRFRAAAASRDGFGGGIDFKFIHPGDDFYEGRTFQTDFDQSDLYFFFMGHASSGNVRVPFRIGPYIASQYAEFTTSGDDTDYGSIGIRFEIEPEIVFVQDDQFEASIFSRLSAGVHSTYIDDESTDEEYDSDGHTLGFEAGIRFAFNPLAVSASYIYHETTVRESDRERGLVIPRLETEFTGIQISMGVRF